MKVCFAFISHFVIVVTVKLVKPFVIAVIGIITIVVADTIVIVVVGTPTVMVINIIIIKVIDIVLIMVPNKFIVVIGKSVEAAKRSIWVTGKTIASIVIASYLYYASYNKMKR